MASPAKPADKPGDHPALDPKNIPGATVPLPSTVNEFVEEIHRRVDLFEVWQSFLRHPDDKLRQRSVERLTDLRYKGTATSDDEPQQIIWDLPRPKRD